MSGTSLDGVDAAWIDTDGETIVALGPTATIPYERKMRIDLRQALKVGPSLAANSALIKSLTERLTDTHADAIEAIGRQADLIGFHGQTILHRPAQRRTWQIGDGQALASRVNIPVAFDFRSADVAAGGQGAPLAPIFHAAMARDLPKPLAVLNIGGVANVTWIGADGTLMACDTGPGNGPLDDWAAQHTGEAFDRDGALAASGTPDEAVLDRLLAHAYFARPAPKSLDRLDFAQALRDSGAQALSPADGAATLASFTARAVAVTALPEKPVRWLVCGGGRHNPAIMAALRANLPAPVDPVEAVGWNGDALEAQCFGFLAARVLAGLPLSFPGTTGVGGPMMGGRIVQPISAEEG
jgi:anhydro-N-acetylmuramic acid kinase